MNSHYFLKSGGKTLGPFNKEQLDSLQVRGRIKADHLISSDRRSWKPADEFFSQPQPNAIAVLAGTADDEWYYAEDQRRVGPLTRSDLEKLFKNGTLKPDDLVWKEGYRDWIPASSAAELRLFDGQPALPVQAASSSLVMQRICMRCGTQASMGGEFCPSCGNRYQIQHTSQGSSLSHSDRKDRHMAALLALLLGGFGIHHFYLGNTLLGVLYILFCWTLIPAFVAFIEGIVFLCTSTSSFDAQYNTRQ